MDRKPQLLVIDDGLTYSEVVAERMPEFELVRGGEPEAAPRIPDGPAAIDFLKQHAEEVDVVLLDMHFDLPEERLFQLDEAADQPRTRRFQGVAILREIRSRFPDMPVVLLTSLRDLSLVDGGEAGSGELANQSMTYFLDSDDLDTLRIRINAALQEAALGVVESDVIWGNDPKMRKARTRLSVLARGRMPVIIEGETGTGKSYLAERFLHANTGRSGPFVVLDLSAIPSELVAAHLFGALRGAYTGSIADRKGVFELAHRGTLFMDEVQNIPLDVQKQLLLVLQDRRVRPLSSSREVEVDVKVIAATNRPLARAVAEGRFRRDLYMRLSPATRVVIPPLRERPGDLPMLARVFAAVAMEEPEIAELGNCIAAAVGLQERAPLTLEMGRRTGQKARPEEGIRLVFPDPAWRLLAEHAWPGNVRELMMVMHNLVTFTLVEAVNVIRAGHQLTSSRFQVDPGLVSTLLAGYAALPGDDDPASQQDDDPGSVRVRIEPGPTLNAVSNSVERQYFERMFRRTNGDFGMMAEALLGDSGKARAVRLRFNQLGLKARELR